jgi:hypothetical protein
MMRKVFSSHTLLCQLSFCSGVLVLGGSVQGGCVPLKLTLIPVEERSTGSLFERHVKRMRSGRGGGRCLALLFNAKVLLQ